MIVLFDFSKYIQLLFAKIKGNFQVFKHQKNEMTKAYNNCLFINISDFFSLCTRCNLTKFISYSIYDNFT